MKTSGTKPKPKLIRGLTANGCRTASMASLPANERERWKKVLSLKRQILKTSTLKGKNPERAAEEAAIEQLTGRKFNYLSSRKD